MGSAELVYWIAELSLRADEEREAYEDARKQAESQQSGGLR